MDVVSGANKCDCLISRSDKYFEITSKVPLLHPQVCRSLVGKHQLPVEPKKHLRGSQSELPAVVVHDVCKGRLGRQ